jgi:hypothetical protein
MAKKPPRAGGRVTPKGTRPAGAAAAPSDGSAGVDRRPVPRLDPAARRPSFGPTGPTRAGHHRGQRYGAAAENQLRRAWR